MFKLKKYTMFTANVVSAFVISNNTYAEGEDNGINLISYFGNLIFFLIIFAGIVFLALYLTKFIAKKTNYLGRSKNLTILEFMNVSANVKIMTVKIYKKVYILSISNGHTTVIDKLDEEDLDQKFEDYLNQNLMQNESDFKEHFNGFKEKIIKKIKDSPKDKD